MGSEKLKKILFKGDKIIWVVFFILCAISWVEVFSATSRQTYGEDSYWLPIIKHSAFLLAGIVVVWFMHNMKVEWIRKLTFGIYWLGLIGLVWAQFDPDSRINDSARWINIFGMTFQPMELAKMGLVMVTALFLAKNQNEEGTKSKALKPILLYALPPIAIIFKENLSTALLLSVTIYMMLFIARIPRKYLLIIFGSGIAFAATLLTVIMLWPNGYDKEEDLDGFNQKTITWQNEDDKEEELDGFNQKIITWQNRIKDVFCGPDKESAEDFDSSDDQMVYSKIAIASSHIIGHGPGNSIQRDFIPHADSDYIYAVIIEELGLIGGIIVMLLYMTILYRSGSIAKKCDDPYPAYLVMGIGMIIVIQALMHMFVSVSAFVTGQPLPLLSKGGTSVIINCLYIGFMLSISRYARKASNKQTEAKVLETAGIEETEEKCI